MANHLTTNRLSDACTVLFLPALGDITHLARHTYATSVCLANGVSIENVAKMLGHSDTKMTRHYARVLDKSSLKDMRKVNERYKNDQFE